MANTILIKKVRSELNKLDIESFAFQDFHPHIDGTFKRNLLTHKTSFTYNSVDSHKICIKMSFDEYNEILFTDFLFGYKRITKQIESLDQLLKESNSPVAWNIVTTYYATFFMAIELCKLLGIYLIHFDRYEVLEWAKISGQPVNDFTGLLLAVREVNELSRDVTIKITKFGDSPHMKIWDQLLGRIRREINKKNSSNSNHYDLELFKSFLSGQNRWEKPSAIRNLWNYNRADFYGELGEDNGNTFSKIIKNYSSSIQWAKSQAFSPNIIHNTSSVAYLYHILKSVTDEINKDLNISS